jgi:pimeloyl-ACP methyl ester carboxylesterase
MSKSARAMRLLKIVLSFYVAFVLICFLSQNSLLYHPFPRSVAETVDDGDRAGLVLWPQADLNYRGLIDETAHGPAKRGTIICVHGNGGNAPNRYYYRDALQPLGFNVLLYEYPGFGARPGTLRENVIVNDLRKTIQRAQQELGGPVYLLGESLGCGVVASAAADPVVPVAGIILITPWDTLVHVAQDRFWFLPVQYLVNDHFDSVSNLKEHYQPIAVAIAEEDEIIPPRLGHHLYETLPEPKKLWVFKNAGHNNWPKNPDLKWWQEMTDFITSAPSTGSKPGL